MVIDVDIFDGRRALTDGDNFTSFRVRARGSSPSRAALENALAGLGVLADDSHAWIDRSALLTLAGDRPPAWSDAFEAMHRFASEHGWTNEAGAIRAHVEWQANAPASA